MEIKQFCSRETQVEAVQWDGSQESTDFIKEWTGYRVKQVDGALLLQSSDLVEQVLPTDYIICVGIGSYHRWTAKEVAEYYAPVSFQTQAV